MHDTEAIPSHFVYDGTLIHRNRITCASCEGSGKLGSIDCGACLGYGTYVVGCGGDVGIDANHPALGADCLRCGYQVPREEVGLRVQG